MMAIAAAENFQLKWHSYGAYMHTSVATLLRSESFTDITLATIDGRQIHAHRFVLSACSSYLHQLLRVMYPIAKNNLPVVIVLPSEITYRILKVLIEYMYSGEATVSYGQLDGILKAAHILGIRGLCRENAVERNPSALSSHKSAHSESSTERSIKLTQQSVDGEERISQDSDRPNSTRMEGHILPRTQGTFDDRPLQLSEIGQNSNQSNEDEGRKRVLERQSCHTENSNSENSNTKSITSPSADVEISNPVQLVVKQEPIEWVDTELEEPDDDLGEQMQTEMTVKPEVVQNISNDDDDDDDETLYTPLTCDICQKTFTAPAEWVRHIEAHPEIYQHSSKSKGSKTEKVPGNTEQSSDFPPLRCELCELVFASPGDWVRHIQNSHTEQELAISNNSYQHAKIKRSGRKLCQVCSKTFPSYASMMIHRRTHTGERPYVCPICSKGFNVKSNLLRHLRTLHDQIVSPSTVD